MEIKLNLGQIPQPESSQPVAKRASTPTASDAVSFATSDSIKAQLNSLSTVRPEQVAKGKELVGSSGYPPNDVLDRIAVLLAIHGRPNPDTLSGPSA